MSGYDVVPHFHQNLNQIKHRRLHKHNTMTTIAKHTLPGPSPPYTSTPQPMDIELARLDSRSPSILTAPPPYDEPSSSSSTSFHPTAHLQIETTGKPWLSLPLPQRPSPIPIFALPACEPSSSTISALPKFTSLRPERGSGSSYLLSASTHAPLSTTTYRFGPNRPPRVRLFSPSSAAAAQGVLTEDVVRGILFSKDDGDEVLVPGQGEEGGKIKIDPWDSFAVTSLGLLTRAVSFRTRLGTFQWRYASRRERKTLYPNEGEEVSCLLVLERVVKVAKARNITNHNNNTCPPSPHTSGISSGSSKYEDEIRTPVAHLLRGPSFRTPGSSASSAGNGGRLVIDELALLSGYSGNGTVGDGEQEGIQEGKEDREMGIAMVVTTCLVMLKREVDRRRAQQIAIMAGAAGSGP